MKQPGMTQGHDELDHRFLQRAIGLAHIQALAGKGGPFGAVIVREGRIIAEGCNEVTSTNDPTAHAEVVAIRQACQAVGHFALTGATIYSSCEPCPMCLAAIYWARLDRLVFANTRLEAAAIGFDDALIYSQVPKAIGERSLPTLHLPVPEGAAAFAEWAAKVDKVAY